jgi:hypothetical protein
MDTLSSIAFGESMAGDDFALPDFSPALTQLSL